MRALSVRQCGSRRRGYTAAENVHHGRCSEVSACACSVGPPIRLASKRVYSYWKCSPRSVFKASARRPCCRPKRNKCPSSDRRSHPVAGALVSRSLTVLTATRWRAALGDPWDASRHPRFRSALAFTPSWFNGNVSHLETAACTYSGFRLHERG